MSVASRETHGIYHDISKNQISIGKVTFPTNTFTLQPATGWSDELKKLGRGVATRLGFFWDMGVVDEFMRTKDFRILRGGPFGHWGRWLVEVRYRDGAGLDHHAMISERHLGEWRQRHAA